MLYDISAKTFRHQGRNKKVLERLSMNLLDRIVAITTGTAFGSYREHFKIALTASDEEIKLGVKKLCEALE